MGKVVKGHIKRAVKKQHYCKCGSVATPVMLIPGRKMKFRCENNHYSNKLECEIR